MTGTRRRRGADTQSPIVIVVTGQPQAQGSKTRTRYGAMREANENLRPWRDAVTWNAVQQTGDDWFDGPVRLSAAFSFRRPKAHYRTGRNAHLLANYAPAYPTGKPDLSKLVRAVEDALTDAGVWRDDAQVVDLSGCRKLWCDHPDGMPDPGVRIEVSSATAEDEALLRAALLRAAGYGDPE